MKRETLQPSYEKAAGQDDERNPEVQAETFEQFLDNGAKLERQVEDFPRELTRETVSEIRRMARENGLSRKDLADIPELRTHALELDRVDADARQLRRRARKELDALWADLKRHGRKLVAGVAVVAGAMGFADYSVQQYQRGERVEQRADALQEAADSLRNNAEVRAEIGDENMETLIRGLESYRPEEVIAAIREISGVDIDEDRVTFSEVRVLTAEQAEAAEEGMGRVSGFVAADYQNVLNLVPRNISTGSLTVEDIHQTMLHENIHSEMRRLLDVRFGSRPESAEEAEIWEGQFARHFKEGLTELMTRRVAEQMGERWNDDSYVGGPVMATRLLETLVGERELARAFFGNDLRAIREALVDRLGEDGADRVLGGNFFRHADEYASIEANALDASLDLIEECRRAGVDVRQLIERAESDPIVGSEQITLSEDGRALLFSYRHRGEYRMNGIVTDDGPPPDGEGMEPMRVFIEYPETGGEELDNVASASQGGALLLQEAIQYRAEHRARLSEGGLSEDERAELRFLDMSTPDYNVHITLEEELQDTDSLNRSDLSPEELRQARERIDRQAVERSHTAALEVFDGIGWYYSRLEE